MKSTIVGVSATIVACVVGIVYTEWRNTDPHIAGEWITVSADFITLALLMMGAFGGFVLVSIGVIRLWPIARWRLRSKQQRFAELAPELRDLQNMTVGAFGERGLPTLTDRTRALVLVEKLRYVGIDCGLPNQSRQSVQAWQRLEALFEMLAVLASEGRLQVARNVGQKFRNEATA